jgi:hypothetical protein
MHEIESYHAAGFDDVLSKPVRFERLYECLVKLPGISAVSNIAALECSADAPFNADLPAELRERFLVAAELYSVTQLRQCIDEAGGTGPASQPLCQLLRRLVNEYDMDGIVRLLSLPEALNTQSSQSATHAIMRPCNGR